MDLDLQKIKDNLKTEDFGQRLVYFEEIDSTSTAAKELNKGNEHGTLVIADTQTSGRGTKGRKWQSPKGVGIWMSLILNTNLEIKDGVKLPTLVSLAVRKALEESTGLDVLVKWPNDIIVNKKKVCGILVESVVQGQNITSLVIGIGVNVKQDTEHFRELEYASSLFIEAGKNFTREEIICNILFYLQKCYNEFIKTKLLDVDEIMRASVLLHKEVSVSYNNNNFVGVVTGFEDDGSINIQDKGGNIINIQSGNATIRGINNYLD